jgi:hypothetical protein
VNYQIFNILLCTKSAKKNRCRPATEQEPNQPNAHLDTAFELRVMYQVRNSGLSTKALVYISNTILNLMLIAEYGACDSCSVHSTRSIKY